MRWHTCKLAVPMKTSSSHIPRVSQGSRSHVHKYKMQAGMEKQQTGEPLWWQERKQKGGNLAECAMSNEAVAAQDLGTEEAATQAGGTATGSQGQNTQQ
eukprot:1158943-Pelagomonas_calceolata.AAC.2